MAADHQLILISTRQEDQALFGDIAKELGWAFQRPADINALAESIRTGPQLRVLVWDVDHPDAQDPKYEFGNDIMTKTLSVVAPPNRVFVLTDKILNAYPEPLRQAALLGTAFHHNLVRMQTPSAREAYSRLLTASFENPPIEIARFFPPGTKVASIPIKKSDEKTTAVENTAKLLEKMGINPRVAAKAAQATDELIMNAIFDAPVDKAGMQTRKGLSRKASFALNKGENIHLDVACSSSLVGIGVTDGYGSLSAEAIMRILGKEYHTQEYKPPKYGESAGIGLNNIIQLGLSLVISCQPKVRTDAMIFFPRAKSTLEFKKQFHFTSFFTGT